VLISHVAGPASVAASNRPGSVLEPVPAAALCLYPFGFAFAFVVSKFSLVSQTSPGTSFAFTATTTGSCRLRWLKPGPTLTIKPHLHCQTGFASTVVVRPSFRQQPAVPTFVPIAGPSFRQQPAVPTFVPIVGPSFRQQPAVPTFVFIARVYPRKLFSFTFVLAH
jgi:hypothetical protein